MNSRVGRVGVKLRLASSDRARADETRRTIEQVVIRNALDELERTIHERYGRTAIVRAHRLSVRWQLAYDTFGELETARELGRDLAASLVAELDALPKPQRLRPAAHANVVVFADEPHAIAAFLADRVDGQDAWFHAPREDVLTEWQEVVARGRPHVEDTVRWLYRMERREEVARCIERSAVGPRSTPRAPASRPAGTSPTFANDDTRAQVSPQLELATTMPLAAQASVVPSPAAASERAAPDASADVFAEVTAAIGVLDTPACVPTRAAGLWYLARLVMQLDLAEQLWSAGVLEGDFLAHVARAVAGREHSDDPCWRWFGGAIDHEPRLDPLPEWAADELAAYRDSSLRRFVPDAAPLDAVAAQLACLTPAEPRAADAVARSAAALCSLFCARLGIATDPARFREYLLLPGRLELGDPLRVVIAMELVDVDLRRSGLDLDPGFLPWLGRKVEIVFETT